MSLIKGKTGANKTTAGRFQYKARSAEEVKERANRSLGLRDPYIKEEAEFYTPRKGDNSVRFLPPTWDDARHYGLDLFLHYSIGSDKSTYICPDKMFGKPCPLCEERVTANSEGAEDLAKALAPKGRVLVWVIDRKDEAKGPLIWSMPAGLDKDIVNCAIDKSTGEILLLDDPGPGGYDVHFKREGEGLKTEYNSIQVARRASPLSDDQKQADAWLSYVTNNPLPDMLIVREYDELKVAFAGTTPRDDERDGDKGGTAAPSKVPARGSKVPARGQPQQEEQQEQAGGSGGGDDDLPTYDQVQEMDEATITELIEEKLLAKEAEEDESIDSLDALKAWVVKRLGIEKPAPAPSGKASGGSWKDRLKAAQNKK